MTESFPIKKQLYIIDNDLQQGVRRKCFLADFLRFDGMLILSV